MKKLALGKVSRESYQDYLDAMDAAAKELEKLGLQEFQYFTPDTDRSSRAYKFMNGMGFLYGAALTRAYTNDLSAEDLALPENIRTAISNLSMLYQDVDARREMKDDSVIRRAAEDLPHLVPEWLNLDEVVADAKASYSGTGVYINDFYWSVLQSISDIAKALNLFLLADKRPEHMAFRRERAGGEFIPTALLDLSEEEEKTLLKRVIKESNKKIAERTSYGLRQERLPKTGDFTILYWSNGPSIWFVDNRTQSVMFARDNGLDSVRLDANQILVPFHQALVQKVISGLDDIPLYVYSTEAKERGEYPEPTDKNVQRAVRSIIEAQNPDLDYEEQAVLAAEMFGHLVKGRRHDRASQAIVAAWLELQPVNILPYIELIKRWINS
jgi:uncharacterized protein YggL (DUF469 family)